jgi:hypothetical protein
VEKAPLRKPGGPRRPPPHGFRGGRFREGRLLGHRHPPISVARESRRPGNRGLPNDLGDEFPIAARVRGRCWGRSGRSWRSGSISSPRQRMTMPPTGSLPPTSAVAMSCICGSAMAEYHVPPEPRPIGLVRRPRDARHDFSRGVFVPRVGKWTGLTRNKIDVCACQRVAGNFRNAKKNTQE